MARGCPCALTFQCDAPVCREGELHGSIHWKVRLFTALCVFEKKDRWCIRRIEESLKLIKEITLTLMVIVLRINFHVIKCI